MIDIDNLNQYLNLNLNQKSFSHLSIAHKSDLVRIELIYKYGGVWVDASLFCLIPLDKWIFNYLNQGVFFFKSSSNLTIIANWFIAANERHETINILRIKLQNYWMKNDFGELNILKKLIRKIISSFLNKNKDLARLWLNPIIYKLFRVYPYQIFYFMFYEIIKKEENIS